MQARQTAQAWRKRPATSRDRASGPEAGQRLPAPEHPKITTGAGRTPATATGDVLGTPSYRPSQRK